MMKVTSPSFLDGERIPEKYTCDGDRLLSPPLTIESVPKEAQSLVLIVDDPDVPKALISTGLFTHWVLFNIPPTTTEIEEGLTIGVAGANTRGDAAYTGPCPPPEYEPREHRYVFSLCALDTTLSVASGATKEMVEAALDGHVLARAALTGVYSRK